MTDQTTEPGKDRITLEVSRDGWTNGIQLSISQLDGNGVGHGYRLAGPKFNGSSETLLTREIDRRDADEIRGYLDAVFPRPDAGLAEARELAKALYDMFGAFPFCLDDVDGRMSVERLPQWIGGDADIWQREGGA